MTDFTVRTHFWLRWVDSWGRSDRLALVSLIVFGFHRNSNLKDSNGIKCAYVVWSCWFDWSVSNVCAVTGESYTGFVLAVTVCCCISSRLGWLYLFGMINKSSLAELELSFVSHHFQISDQNDCHSAYSTCKAALVHQGSVQSAISLNCMQSVEELGWNVPRLCHGIKMRWENSGYEIQSNRIKSCRKVGGVWKWSNQKLLV